MNSPIYPLELILKLNTRLFMNTLAGVNELQSEKRISEHNNSLKWIATHTVWARYNLLAFLGKPDKNPYSQLFEKFRAYDPSDSYPTLQELKDEWQKASSLLEAALKSVTSEQLAAESSFKGPVGDQTNLGALAFLTQHESYDVGQLGLLKKYLTKEAMAYT